MCCQKLELGIFVHEWYLSVAGFGIYLMQQWFQLSDPMMEDALYEIESMRRFAKLELCEDLLPDETTILKFRHLLDRNQLTDKLFAAVSEHLKLHSLALSKGTMVDATLIRASSSPKNAKGMTSANQEKAT